MMMIMIIIVQLLQNEKLINLIILYVLEKVIIRLIICYCNGGPRWRAGGHFKKYK